MPKAGTIDNSMTAHTIAARVAAHQRARILRDAAWRCDGGTLAEVLDYHDAAQRQEAIGNGQATE